MCKRACGLPVRQSLGLSALPTLNLNCRVSCALIDCSRRAQKPQDADSICYGCVRYQIIMRSLSRFPRWGRRSTLLAPSAFRVEVKPPSLRHAPESAWQRVMFWLLAPAPQEAAPPLNRLPLVRAEFLATLADVANTEVEALRNRIESAHSLRDLWHLRSEVFSTLGVALSQTQAEERLGRLNRHFPTRTPRTQYSPG